MVMFDSEKDLVEKLCEHFEYVKDFSHGKISFNEFQGKYNDFYFVYALDGHESDEEENNILKKYHDKILFHDKVSWILSNLCSDEDALKEDYIKAGRYNSESARKKFIDLLNNFNG